VSSKVDLVLLNFKWRIERIIPSWTKEPKRFRWNDAPPPRFAPEQSSGSVRLFTVYCDSEGALEEPTSQTETFSNFIYTVEVAYPGDGNILDVQQMIARDRYDLKEVLRDDTKWIGYEGNTSADIGLANREFVSSTVDRASDVTWYMRQVWRCTIEETA